MSSSASDTDAYRSLCARAAQDAVTFKRFKRDPAYTRVLEHVSEAQGAAYLACIRRIAPELLTPQFFGAFRRNDNLGDPALSWYPDVGHVSPTTLRYVKVAADLRGQLGPHGVLYEVGGGYGGQARIFKLLWPDWAYTIVDLPEPLALARRFLGELGIDGVTFLSMTDVQTAVALCGDVFLSNYALTECALDVHRLYIERIALNCTRGYITGNALEVETLARLASVQPCRFPEDPLTGPANFLLRWP